MRHPNVRRRIAAQKREARAFYELRRQKREQEKTPVPANENPSEPKVAHAWRGWLWTIIGFVIFFTLGAAIDWLLH